MVHPVVVSHTSQDNCFSPLVICKTLINSKNKRVKILFSSVIYLGLRVMLIVNLYTLHQLPSSCQTLYSIIGFFHVKRRRSSVIYLGLRVMLIVNLYFLRDFKFNPSIPSPICWKFLDVTMKGGHILTSRGFNLLPLNDNNGFKEAYTFSICMKIWNWIMM